MHVLGEAIEGMYWLCIALAAICLIALPLGIWKLVDIVWWLFHHVRWAP